jgi:beta propeller repeat protein
MKGNRAIWDTGFDICVYDLETKKLHHVSEQPWIEDQNLALDFCGDDIVWLLPTANLRLFDLMHHDLRTGQTRAVKRNVPLVVGLHVSDGQLVWSDARNGNHDVYLYDLRRGTERALSASPANERNPVNSGSRVVWSTFKDPPEGSGDHSLEAGLDSIELPAEPGPAAFTDALDLIDQVQARMSLSRDGQAATVLFRNLETSLSRTPANGRVARQAVSLRVPMRTKGRRPLAIRQILRGFADLAPAARATLVIDAAGSVTNIDLSNRPGRDFERTVEGAIRPGTDYMVTIILLVEYSGRASSGSHVGVDSLDVALVP